MCSLFLKKFPYEDSSYDEVVLNYDDDLVDEWEEENPELFNEFWNFANSLELIDFETEELKEKCRIKYAEVYKLYSINGENKKSDDSDDVNMKAV